jgi:UDP-N-acetyl-D-mannosaminuronic acid dehydrogenase
MKVSVVGLGYIGLPTAALIASHGVEVVGFDVNQNIVDTINNGKIHILEPGLDIAVQESIKAGFLRATICLEKSDIFIIAVPTPLKGDKEPDLSYVESAFEAIAPLLEKGNVVILESTVPVGTTEKMLELMQALRSDLYFPKFNVVGADSDISVSHCPERVLPGQIMRELVENDRVIGGITRSCAERTQDLYNIFIEGNCLITDCRTAELSKLVENAFRDVNIAFANELSLICEKLKMNVWDLIKLANLHPRVDILQPGPGVGGHCIAVDPWFIINSSPEEAKLIHTARLVNDSKPQFVLKQVNRAVVALKKKRKELNIACLGLSFKPNIDDLRESPALSIALQISLMGFYKQYIVEPNIKKIPNEFDKDLVELVSIETAITKSDILVLLVDHEHFKKINQDSLLGKQVIDTRGVLNEVKDKF